MEDWLKCQISSLVKYRQNQNQTFLKWEKNPASTATFKARSLDLLLNVVIIVVKDLRVGSCFIW